MPIKSSTSKRKSGKVSKRQRRLPAFLLLRLFVIISCVLVAWLFWLDYRIQSEFEGKRWSLPARVYARAMEVYIDQALSMREFEKELRAIGYQRQTKLRGVGQYQGVKNSIELIKRPFAFWDGNEDERRIRVSFSGDRVSDIRILPEGKSQGVFRLEPQLIGKIYPQHNEDRVVLPYREVPPFLVDALVAVEDRHFFSHGGLDIRGILRALITNLRQGRISQGGSTLTQQLVKNFFLSHERTYWRKFNEMIMSLLLERRYSKADILSAYINEIYLGQHGARGIHGFGTAAEYYFAKPLQELRKDQIALLVGLVKGASYYNPYRQAQRALKRRNLVLQLMKDQNYPNATQLETAQSMPLDLADKPTWGRAKYPAFLDLVKRQLLRDYQMEDLRNEGLRIFTTLNPSVQDKMEKAAQNQLALLEKQKQLETGSLETAVVVLDVASGEVVGLIGGRQRNKVSFNRAIDAKRPIGSLVKPAVYYTALSRPSQFNVLSRVDDSAISIKQKDNSYWQPRNYDRKTHENVTLLDALAHSYNQATVRLGMQLGLDQVIHTLEEIGIKENMEAYPSLLLGAIEMKPVDVAQMYQSFANGGFQVPYNSIREVLDSKGRALQRYPLKMDQVLEPAAVFLTNFMMTQVVANGTGQALLYMMPKIMPLAGKTGTTNELRDSWFAGFGDDLLAVVWVGRDDNKPTRLTGASGAMRIWASMMGDIKIKPLNLVPPEDIDWLSTQQQACIKVNSVPYIRAYRPASFDCK
jgi:penicillin-binding protein 1B